MSDQYQQFVTDALKPFEAWQIEKLPKGGTTLDYVGHAHVTQRLLELDPFWTWEFVAQDPNTGLPIYDEFGGLWIRLTVKGVSRYGYGEPSGGFNAADRIKSAIGDAIRNAAMRFGIALTLWQNEPPAAPVWGVKELKKALHAQGAKTADEALKMAGDLINQKITNFDELRPEQLAALKITLEA